MHVKKGDLVKILAGRDKGKQGHIIRAIPKENRVVVEKVNLVKRHQRPSPAYPEGGIITKEAPIHVSNVMIICSSCKKPTRIAHKFLDNGKKVRACKHCGASLD
ncbi:ribosomal protein L24 [Sulfobacillus acidophilus TPY]|uniref:Large ribosomal subunit protein uL24 n=1 Tax=Sulfobacillus acidophilus (strain ATCC 700253 / DSM 10332 / NAL) TaxID=679936 RepID=G8TXG8_SULAD|nr:ribosomal protein L24 [Sulfobacillus acidophilus TPY]AEW03867.1 LSU ribosomal protein L24P [Sulfobacillus acidophilus DSM 10332]MCY0863338.1 50S ribosomal protein L24 [Sulfobacillus sp.]